MEEIPYNKTKSKKRSIAVPIIAVTMLLAGVLIFLYPVISNRLAEKSQSRIISTYHESIDKSSEEELAKQWEAAEQYNENLAGDPVHDPFVPGSGYALPKNYLSVLNTDGIMGYIEIPKISVNLPIYHGTTDEVLQKGVGHIESTSLPIGGLYRHSVLTGHRGLPSAELFTNLDRLTEGDYFYLHILDKTLAYKVDQVKIIEPSQLEELSAEKGKDYVTLVTCHPYGVNSHRLLVRGSRTDYIPPEDAVQDTAGGLGDTLLSSSVRPYVKGGIIGFLILIILIPTLIIVLKKRKEYYK